MTLESSYLQVLLKLGVASKMMLTVLPTKEEQKILSMKKSPARKRDAIDTLLFDYENRL